MSQVCLRDPESFLSMEAKDGGEGEGEEGEGFWLGMTTIDSTGTLEVQEDRGVCTHV